MKRDLISHEIQIERPNLIQTIDSLLFSVLSPAVAAVCCVAYGVCCATAATGSGG